MGERGSGFSRILALCIVIFGTAVSNSLPTYSSGGRVDPPAPGLVFYDDFEELKKALLHGRTVSFTVIPGNCVFGTRIATTDTLIGLTSKHWTIEASEAEGVTEEIHIRGLRMDADQTAGANAYRWVHEEIVIDSNNVASYVSVARRDNDAETPPAERLGKCTLGTAIKALDLLSVTASTASSTDLVSLSDYNNLVSELMSGRDVVGWVNMSMCNGDASATSPIIQGVAIDYFSIENAERASERITLSSTWFTGVEFGGIMVLSYANKLQITVPAQVPENVTVNHYKTNLNDPTGASMAWEKISKEIQIQSVPRINVECTLQDGVHLFTRRYEQESEVYPPMDNIFSAVESGFPVHNLVHEGYCTDNLGNFAGDKIRGMSIRNWDSDKLPGTHTLSMFHMGAKDNEYLRCTTATLQEAQNLEGVISMEEKQSVPFPSNTPGQLSRSSCFMGSSSFLKVAVQSGSFRPFNNINEPMDLISSEDVLPAIDGIFHRFFNGSVDKVDSTIRTSFHWLIRDPDLNQLKAYSIPWMILNPDTEKLEWRSDTLTIKTLQSGLHMTSVTRITVEVGSVSANFGDPWLACTWTDPLLVQLSTDIDSQELQGHQGRVSPCSFKLLPSY